MVTRHALALALAVLASVAGAGADVTSRVTEPRDTGNVTRREQGDTFLLTDGSCTPDACAEYAADGAVGGGGARAADTCACACSQRAPLFREDRALCVDDISECSLANFGSGSTAQKIPFVFLPLKGQIIHPSKDITFTGVKTPICAVSGAQFLTRKGFVDLRNTIDADVPFTLFRDEGRTFLQWSGEADMRVRMTGRVMLVRLLCRDVWAAAPAPASAPSAVDLRGVFTPCVAFRVQGSPAHHITNVSEVQFALNAATTETTVSSGLSVSEYIAIGISSVLLGLIYVASVFLYLHIRKRRKRAQDEENSRKRTLKGLKNKDGTSIREHDIIRINNDRVQTLPSTLDQAESGIVKSNPLLSMGRQFHDLKNYTADSGSNHSDSEDQTDYADGDENSKRLKNQYTSAVIHPNIRIEPRLRTDSFNESVHRDESGIERLPDEHVSIVETTDSKDDKTDIVRPIGNMRRKLYFNPAYFEPHLMAEPPAAALEFLTKIREVITIAKHKMSTKRFQPVLNEIPEEETYQTVLPSLDFYQGLGSQRSGSAVSLKRENSRKRPINCVGCPGCKSQSYGDLANNVMTYEVPACTNCLNKSRGDKQNSIRKWLDEIPIQPNTMYNEIQSNASQNVGLLNSLLSLPINHSRNKVRKENSFSHSLYAEDHKHNHSIKKKNSSCSVRSEPIFRNYNFPLPDFDNIECDHNNFHRSTATASVDVYRQGSIRDYHSGSVRGKTLANQRRNKFITNKNSLPDMVSEAIAIDSSKVFNQSSSDEEKMYSKRNGPLSQIRKSSASPQGIDYETDSLERNSLNKSLSTPTEYADEMPSSQASPSLSAALPLEEELTMRNAVYKTNSSSDNSNTPSPNIDNNGNLYETIGEPRASHLLNSANTSDRTIKYEPRTDDDYSLVSEVYVNNYNFGTPPSSPSASECSMGSRKLTNSFKAESEKPGCLTIVVQDPPENYIKIHESDGFEPDTLDRKHPRHKEILENIQFSRKDLLSNIQNQDEDESNKMIQLKSSGTFKRSTPTSWTEETKFSDNQCNSLKKIFENKNNTFTRSSLTTELLSGSKSLDETSDQNVEIIEWNSEEGRILTLELRHSKRQRQCTPPSIKQIKSLVRPDVLPPLPPVDDSPIYEQPAFPPRRVECSDSPKNLNGRSLSPRISTSNLPTDSDTVLRKQSAQYHPHTGPACSPLGASVQTQHSDYENAKAVRSAYHRHPTADVCRNYGGGCKSRNTTSNRPRHDSNQYSNIGQPTIDSNTFVKNHEGVSKQVVRPKRVQQKVDSGYLSSDSTGSQRAPRRPPAAKHASGSESDDTENEARSESGAESIETHSVFFGSLRKFTLQPKELGDSFDSKRSGFRRGNSKKGNANNIANKAIS